MNRKELNKRANELRMQLDWLVEAMSSNRHWFEVEFHFDNIEDAVEELGKLVQEYKDKGQSKEMKDGQEKP